MELLPECRMLASTQAAPPRAECRMLASTRPHHPQTIIAARFNAQDSELKLLKLVRLCALHISVRLCALHRMDGELKPGMKGISLQVADWNTICSAVADIDRAVQQQDMSYNLYLSGKRIGQCGGEPPSWSEMQHPLYFYIKTSRCVIGAAPAVMLHTLLAWPLLQSVGSTIINLNLLACPVDFPCTTTNNTATTDNAATTTTTTTTTTTMTTIATVAAAAAAAAITTAFN
eukprot:1144916-Pelagomonas_calceolata.AAC.3